jgi:ribonuclease P protein component
VDRNRLKRRLRELVRLELLPTLRARPAADVAIRARREAYAADVPALRRDILSIAMRLATNDPAA